MSLPRKQKMIEPLLRTMRDGELYSRDQLQDVVIDHFEIKPDVLEARGGAGRTKLNKDLSWVLGAGYGPEGRELVKVEEDGKFKITDKGIEHVSQLDAFLQIIRGR